MTVSLNGTVVSTVRDCELTEGPIAFQSEGAEVHLRNTDGYLRPGMYGKARVLLDTRQNVVTVPSTALQRRGNQVELFYVDPTLGIAKRAPVEIGWDDGVRVQVRGLKGKEQIIAKGNGMIHEGDKVLAVPAASP